MEQLLLTVIRNFVEVENFTQGTGFSWVNMHI